jgi:hypothetical protein
MFCDITTTSNRESAKLDGWARRSRRESGGHLIGRGEVAHRWSVQVLGRLPLSTSC